MYVRCRGGFPSTSDSIRAVIAPGASPLPSLSEVFMLYERRYLSYYLAMNIYIGERYDNMTICYDGENANTSNFQHPSTCLRPPLKSQLDSDKRSGSNATKQPQFKGERKDVKSQSITGQSQPKRSNGKIAHVFDEFGDLWRQI